jgi:hypothetical protein
MKKLCIITLGFLLLIAACKKDKSSTPSGTPVTASGMTATETAMVGLWIWDKNETWSGGVLVSTNIAPVLVTCENKTSFLAGIVSVPQSYEGVYTEYSTPSSTLYPWMVDTTTMYPKTKVVMLTPIQTGPAKFIETLTATNLVLTDYPGTTASGKRYFFHK